MSYTLHTDLHRKLIDLLKEARGAAGLTQQALAERLRRPQSFVAKYETGERRIDAVELIVIAEALDQDPIVLFAALLPKTRKGKHRA